MAVGHVWTQSMTRCTFSMQATCKLTPNERQRRKKNRVNPGISHPGRMQTRATHRLTGRHPKNNKTKSRWWKKKPRFRTNSICVCMLENKRPLAFIRFVRATSETHLNLWFNVRHWIFFYVARFWNHIYRAIWYETSIYTYSYIIFFMYLRITTFYFCAFGPPNIVLLSGWRLVVLIYKRQNTYNKTVKKEKKKYQRIWYFFYCRCCWLLLLLLLL